MWRNRSVYRSEAACEWSCNTNKSCYSFSWQPTVVHSLCSDTYVQLGDFNLSSEGSVPVNEYMRPVGGRSTVFQFIDLGCVCFSWWKLEGGGGILGWVGNYACATVITAQSQDSLLNQALLKIGREKTTFPVWFSETPSEILFDIRSTVDLKR